MRIHRYGALAALGAALVGWPAASPAETIWKVDQGRTIVSLNVGRLEALGLVATRADAIGSERAISDQMGLRVEFVIDPASTLTFETSDGIPRRFLGGQIRHDDGLRLTSPDADYPFASLSITRWEGESESAFAITGEPAKGARPALELRDTKIGFDAVAESLLIESGELVISPDLARALGLPELRGERIGSLTLQASIVWVGGEAPPPPPEESADSGLRAIGPDVIVGDLHNVSSYGSQGGISAFSVGTTSCNQGDQTLKWISDTNEHPVIAQNMYRLKQDRFEQVGMSWLKHGFLALAEDACNLGCTPPGTGTRLGVGCSDPYDASLNGSQGNLGPRFEVNAHTGVFPYPFTSPPYSGTIARRLQVKNSDLDPAMDGGGLYFVEGQYVTVDDAAAGNQDNNASHRPIDVSGGGSSWSISLTGSTQREQPAIRAWNNADPSVVESDVYIPGEGFCILAGKASDLGGGLWHYEYALQNVNSDRSVGAFAVPVPDGALISNVDFHDVDYHSGEPFDLTDWAPTVAGGEIRWATENYATNPNANALRWGTLYNFRFDVDAPPQAALVRLDLFKPGTPASVTAVTVGPNVGSLDCNTNGVPDDEDIAAGRSQDCNSNGIADECETFPITPLAAVEVASGLSQPVFVTSPPDDFDRLFVVEQTGAIKILYPVSGSVLPTPFLDLSGVISVGGERGLLSMAFHPDYNTNGYLFVDYTNTAGDTVIARYTVSGGDPNVADPGSAVVLKTLVQDFANHNGGQLQFGPDGNLYVGMGDGGSGNDPLNRGQDLNSLLGKLLRLDVDAGPPYVPPDNPFVGTNGLDETWAYGVRNPWRFSFDRLTGDLYVADAGQDAREEIDFQPADSPGGENYGWRCMEGFSCTGLSGCICDDPSLTLPILEVVHTNGVCAITGGYVYRGCEMPDLAGTYFYADYCADWIRSFRYVNGAVTDEQDRTAELTPTGGPIGSIVSFGEDAAGELYIVSQLGGIYKIVPAGGGAAICGNEIVEPGEECDDGNDLPGDGCFNCQFEDNDDCDNAVFITEGSHPFDTTTATTDGPAHSAEGCETGGDGGQTYQDIWFIYEATCDGTLTVSTCDAVNYDSDLVMYDGIDCGNLAFLACNDDATGCANFSSELTAPVVQGNSYLIRVGGWNSGDSGSGTLTLTNDGFPCGTCGNDIVEPGEECDPPDGLTCDANCQLIQCETVVFEDHFETSRGWTVQNVNLAAGAWEQGAPAGDGTRGDPTDDFDGGGQCYLTGNAAGDSDVDGGPTRLLSPAIDLSAGNVTLSYAYWFTRDDSEGNDALSVEVSVDGGSAWTPMTTHDTGQSAWRTQSVRLDDFVTPTATTRIRFSVLDNPNNSIVEAGVDAVVLTRGCDDCNNNGIDDAVEVALGTSPDCNGNDLPDSCDLSSGTSQDCDGGPVGDPAGGATLFGTWCFACHNSDGSGGQGFPGPNIRNKSRVQLWNKLLPPTNHPGGAHPEFLQEDFANLEAFLADAGSRGRPDLIPDDCQTLTDCNSNSIADACDLEASTLADLDYDGVPDSCQAPPGDCDGDGDVDLDDFADLETCLLGPGGGLGVNCDCFDLDADGDVTLVDFGDFQVAFTGS